MNLKKTHAWFEYFVVGLFSLLVQIILNYFINKVGGLTYLANFNQCIEAIGITFCLTIFGLIVLSLRILTKQIFIIPFLIQLPLFYFYNFFWYTSFLGSYKSYYLPLNGQETQQAKLLLFVMFWVMLLCLWIGMKKIIFIDYKKMIVTFLLILFLFDPVLKFIFNF
jgi:hypothetical protein